MRCRAHAVFWSTAVSAGRLGDFAVWCPCPALPPGLLGGGLEGGWWNRKGLSRNPEVVAHRFTRDLLETEGSREAR